MMIRRQAAPIILRKSKIRPILLVTGPRRSGKTALLRMLFPRHGYFDLETPEAYESVRTDPLGFLKRHAGDGKNLFIDEYRRVPELSIRIREAAQNVGRPGMFILATSYLPRADGVAGPPLTTLTATQTLLPLSISELNRAKIILERDEYIFKGFMPRIHEMRKMDPQAILREHLAFYTKRDANRLIGLNNRSLPAFERLLKQLALRIGQPINLYSLAEAANIPRRVLPAWLSALEDSYLTFRLPGRYGTPPKFYFTDVGVAALLLGIKGADQVFRDPKVGHLFENMVVADAFKCRHNTGRSADLSYYRDRKFEIDLLVRQKYSTLPIEIKCTQTYSGALAESVESFKRTMKVSREGYVIYGGVTKTTARHGLTTKFINFRDIADVV